MANKLIPVMLIGAMKSGTTSLYDLLVQHPEICGAVRKEPEYFSVRMGLEELKKGRYEDLFSPDAAVHKFSLDGSTGYTKFSAETGVPERIKSYGLEPFFIYLLRNPIDRIRSHYNYMQRDLSWKGDLLGSHLVNTSSYAKQLQQYLPYFSKDRILILDFDELKQSPDRVLKTVFEFIGASDYKRPQVSASAKNITQPVNRKRLQLQQRASKASRFTPKFVKDLGRFILRRLFPDKQKQLSPKQQKILRQLLSEDMQQLQQ